MRKFGLVGYPLGHSFSKKYFAEKFASQKISDCVYDNYPLENLDHFIELINSDKEIIGLNVTIPYKSRILKFVDVLEPEAGEIGAVNVLKIKRQQNKNTVFGYNSDVTGIRDTLLPYINDNVRNALVLGTGGSSRAVCHVLDKFGLKIKLVSRDKKPGVLSYPEITSEVIGRNQLIVNTTPLGMFPDIESKPPIDYSALTKNHILFDLVYNPELTSFLKMGTERECIALSGLKMLHSQAEKAWEIWNNDDM
jgi:shikimate dehydrogenase